MYDVYFGVQVRDGVAAACQSQPSWHVKAVLLLLLQGEFRHGDRDAESYLSGPQEAVSLSYVR